MPEEQEKKKDTAGGKPAGEDNPSAPEGGKVSPEEAIRIQSSDLPSGGPS